MYSTMTVPMYATNPGRASVAQGYNQRGAHALAMPIFKGPTLSSYPYAASGAFDLGYMPEQPVDTRQRSHGAPTMSRSRSRSGAQYPTDDERSPPRSRSRVHSNAYSYQPAPPHPHPHPHSHSHSRSRTRSHHASGPPPPLPPSNRNMYFYTNPSMTASTKSDVSGTEYDEEVSTASYSSPTLSVDSMLAIKSPLFSGSSMGGGGRDEDELEDTPNTSPNSSVGELHGHGDVKQDYVGETRSRRDSMYPQPPLPPPPASAPHDYHDRRQEDAQRAARRHAPSRSSSVSTARGERGSVLLAEGQGPIPSFVRQPDTPNISSSSSKDREERERDRDKEREREKEKEKERASGSGSGSHTSTPPLPPPPSSSHSHSQQQQQKQQKQKPSSSASAPSSKDEKKGEVVEDPSIVGTSDAKARFFTDSDLDLAEKGNSRIPVTLPPKDAQKSSRPLRRRPGSYIAEQDYDYDYDGHHHSRPHSKKYHDGYDEPSSPFLAGRHFDEVEAEVLGGAGHGRMPPVTAIVRSLSPASSVGHGGTMAGSPGRSNGYGHRADRGSKYDQEPLPIPPPRVNVNSTQPDMVSGGHYRPMSTYAPHLTTSPEPVMAVSASGDPDVKYKKRHSRSVDPVEHGEYPGMNGHGHGYRRSPVHSHASDSSHSSGHSHSSSRRLGSEGHSERMKRLPTPAPSSYYPHHPHPQQHHPDRDYRDREHHRYYPNAMHPHHPPPQMASADPYRRQSFYNMAPAVFDDLPGSAQAAIAATSGGGGPSTAIHVRVNERSSTYEITSPLSDVSELEEFVHRGLGVAPVPHPQRVDILRRGGGGERPESKRRSSDSDVMGGMRPFQPPMGERERRYTDSVVIGMGGGVDSEMEGMVKRGVRWNDNLICPSPIFPHQRRKGWFNKKGEQLWTNDGAFKPPAEGDEYPLDLVDYPDCGDGWMNEEGVKIDMKHRLVPKSPPKSALKRR